MQHIQSSRNQVACLIASRRHPTDSTIFSIAFYTVPLSLERQAADGSLHVDITVPQGFGVFEDDPILKIGELDKDEDVLRLIPGTRCTAGDALGLGRVLLAPGQFCTLARVISEGNPVSSEEHINGVRVQSTSCSVIHSSLLKASTVFPRFNI